MEQPSPSRQSDDSIPVCSVCLDSIVEGAMRSTAKLQCGHRFHLDCIGSAFNMKGAMECPNCRGVENGRWLYWTAPHDNIINLEELMIVEDDHFDPHPDAWYHDPNADQFRVHQSFGELVAHLPQFNMWMEDVLNEFNAALLRMVRSITIEEFVHPLRPPPPQIGPAPAMLHGGVGQHPPPAVSPFPFPTMPSTSEQHPPFNQLPYDVPHAVPDNSGGGAPVEVPPSEPLGLRPYPQQQVQGAPREIPPSEPLGLLPSPQQQVQDPSANDSRPREYRFSILPSDN